MSGSPLEAVAQWLHRFRRQHGPLVRLWDRDFNLVHTEPQRIESWQSWRNRQRRRWVSSWTSGSED